MPYEALQTLLARSRQRGRPVYGRPGFGEEPEPLSEGELFRQAGRDPATVAPGAGAYAQSQLKDRLGRAAETGATERNLIDRIRESQLSARMKGFETPQAEAEYGRAQERRKLELPLEEARVQAETTIDRLMAAQAAQDERTRQQIGSREGIAEASQAAQTERSARNIAPAFARELQLARQTYQSPVSRFTRMLGADAGTRHLMDAYTNILRDAGSLDMITQAAQQTVAEGLSADDAIAQAQAAGVVLDPTEQDALRLFVEQLQRGRR